MSQKNTDALARHYEIGIPATTRARSIRRRAARYISVKVAGDIYAAVEMSVVFLAGITVAYLYVHNRLQYADFVGSYIWPILMTVLIYAFVNYRANLYDLPKLSRFARYSGRAIGGLVGAFVTVALVGVVVGAADEFSRIWFGTWLVASIAAIWILRALAARFFASLSARGAIRQQVAVYGSGAPLHKVLQSLPPVGGDVRIVGVYGPAAENVPGESRRYDGDISELIAFGRSEHLDTVIVALPTSSRRRLRTVLSELSVLPTEIKLLPSFGIEPVPLYGISSFDETQFIDLQRKPISDWGRLAKALEDYSIAALAVLLLAPLLLLIAAAIRIDSNGPVLFRQVRHGLNNKNISVYKFRTMHVQPPSEVFRQAIRNDHRVTRVGRVLRRLSLDELPQLFNVLKGEMSIVGPRPHPVELNAMYADFLPMFGNRHRMKPGITGWAQVNDHRGPTKTVDDMRKRLDCDLYYIENWSVLFDISIIAATPFIGLVHKNAV